MVMSTCTTLQFPSLPTIIIFHQLWQRMFRQCFIVIYTLIIILIHNLLSINIIQINLKSSNGESGSIPTALNLSRIILNSCGFTSRKTFPLSKSSDFSHLPLNIAAKVESLMKHNVER